MFWLGLQKIVYPALDKTVLDVLGYFLKPLINCELYDIYNQLEGSFTLLVLVVIEQTQYKQISIQTYSITKFIICLSKNYTETQEKM